MIKRIWRDPVGSKIIAVGIIGILSLIYAKVISTIDNITIGEAYQSIFDVKIRLVYIVGALILFFLLKRIISKKKSYYTSKQKRLRKFNHSTDPNVFQNWILKQIGLRLTLRIKQ